MKPTEQDMKNYKKLEKKLAKGENLKGKTIQEQTAILEKNLAKMAVDDDNEEEEDEEVVPIFSAEMEALKRKERGEMDEDEEEDEKMEQEGS